MYIIIEFEFMMEQIRSTSIVSVNRKKIMIFLNKYLIIMLLFSSAFYQELEDQEIIVSKNELITIAESLVESGDYLNAIAIYQQILDYQINNYGIINEGVSNTSFIIGELMIEAANFEDAEIYLTQSVRIQSKLLLEKQISLQPSLTYLREIYNINNDSTKVEEIDNQLEILSNANLLSRDEEYWNPITFGLDNIISQNDSTEFSDYSNYQSMNLVNIADSYIEAGLYYDAITYLLKAIDIDTDHINIEFLYDYVNKNIIEAPQLINALINYTNSDSTYQHTDKFFLSLIHYYRAEDELGNYYINDYIKNNPSDYRSFELLGDEYFKKDDYLSALFNYKKAELINSKSLYTLFRTSLCLYNLSYYEDVIEFTTRILAQDEYYENAYYFRALSHLETNNYKKAISDLTDYILLNPDNEEIYYYLGMAYFNTKKYNRANEALKRYMKFNPENGQAHYYLGMINENILELDDAINHYTLARKFNPKLIDANLRLGLLHYKNQNYKRAVEPLRDYIIYNPDSISVLETFSEVLVQEKRYPESIDAYYKLYELNPSDNKYLSLIADSYIALNKLSEAKDLLTKLILLGEVDANILFKLGNIESDLNEHDNAISHYLMAIDMGNQSVDIYYNLAMSYAYIGNYMQALLGFQNAYKINPDDKDLIFQIAMCYKEMEIYPKAIDYMNLFIGASNDTYIAHYFIGELYYLIEDYDSAEVHFNKSLSLNSQDYLSFYYLGRCYLEKQDYIKAAKYLKKSVKIEPDNPSTHYYLALTYDALGKKREVKKQMNIIYMLDQSLYNNLITQLENK